MANPKRNRRRGSAMIEFALAYPILFLAMSGTFHFGYVFLTYDSLQTAIRAGSRFASLADFDGPDGSDFAEDVKDVVVYGKTDPDVSVDSPLVFGLTTEDVVVDSSDRDGSGMPITVTVSISGFAINTFVDSYSLNSKPSSQFVYQGKFK